MFLPTHILLPPSPRTWTAPPSTPAPSSSLISTTSILLMALSITTSAPGGPPLPRPLLWKMARSTRQPSPLALRTRRATLWLRTILGTLRSWIRANNSGWGIGCKQPSEDENGCSRSRPPTGKAYRGPCALRRGVKVLVDARQTFKNHFLSTSRPRAPAQGYLLLYGRARLALEKLPGPGELAGLLEGPMQELAAFLALFVAPRLRLDGVDRLLDAGLVEGDVGQPDDDLPDLAVDEVRLSGVDPGLARADPRPALHADGVLDVLVFEAEHLDAQAVLRYQLGLYADLRGHDPQFSSR